MRRTLARDLQTSKPWYQFDFLAIEHRFPHGKGEWQPKEAATVNYYILHLSFTVAFVSALDES